MMFNGYLPTTHQGLINTIDRNKPFSTPVKFYSKKTKGFMNWVRILHLMKMLMIIMDHTFRILKKLKVLLQNKVKARITYI